MGRFREQIITYMLIIFVLLLIISRPLNVEADSGDSKVVKVGLTNWNGFGLEKDGELFRNYSFEYFEKLREVTGLNFVYANYTWDEALTLLEEKKIDAVLGASYTENRGRKYAFINPSVIKKNIDILALKDASDLKNKSEELDITLDSINDIDLPRQNSAENSNLIIKGRKFGIVGNFDHKYERLLEERAGGNTKVIVKRFDSNRSLKQALLNGEIDYIIGASYISPDEQIKRIDVLTQDEFYLVANPNKESLINKLGDGIIKIQKNEDDYNKKLIAKYSQKNEEALVLSESEKKLLSSLDKITFYVLKGNDINYKVQDDGTVTGLYSKYIPKIANVLHKDYEVIPLSFEEFKKPKKPGFYFDIIVNYKIINELFGTKMISKPIFAKQVLFYENNSFVKNDDEKIYASHYPSYMKKYIKFGDKMLRTKDDKESLRFLTENKADIAIVDYSMEHYINSMLKYKNIQLIGLEGDIPISILVVNTNDQDYLGIINKVIELIPKDYLRLANAEEQRSYIYEPTIVEIIKSNIELVVGLLIIVLIIGFMVIKMLITKNKKIEIITEDTNKTNSVKDDFISRVSHDMRTPLNAIISYSDFGIEEKRNPDDVDYFQKIKDSSYNLLYLMKDVLELQRLESNNNKGNLNIEILHIGTLFAEMNTEIKEMAKKKNIELTNGFKFNTENATATKYVKVNKKAVKQVVSNILYNAVKYTPNGGKISWNVEMSKEGNYIIVTHTISDTGIGISEEFQKNMYDDFSVGDKELTNNDPGTGLGLAIALKAIKVLGGTINCKSEVKKGTTFKISFSLELPSEKEIKDYEDNNDKLKLVKLLKNSELTEKQKVLISNNDEGELKKLEGKKILICEDAIINALIIEKILFKYKMKFIWAENGAQGLELIKKDKFDLILMDVQMPIMDGLCATSEIRELGIRIPIIGLSGSNDEIDIKKALDVGMNDYLEKPINKSKLLEKMFQYIIYLNE